MKNFAKSVLWLLTVVFPTASQLHAQELNIALHPQVDRQFISVIMQQRALKDTIYKGLSTSKYSRWQLYSSSFFENQSAYERVGMALLKELEPSLDTTFIFHGRIKRNEITSFVGQDSSGSFYAVVDANNNEDFTDDKWFEFPVNTSKNMLTDKQELACKISFYDGKRLKDTVIKLDVDFLRFPADYEQAEDKNNNGRLSGKFELRLLKKSYKLGKVDYKGTQYAFFVSDPYYNLYPPTKDYTLSVRKLPLRAKDEIYLYTSTGNDTIRVGNSLFNLAQLTSRRLSLIYIKEVSYGDASIGSTLPPGMALELSSGRNVVLNENSKKYTLVDFWASWCGPCIAAMPRLRSLYLKYKDKVQVVSLAIDRMANKQKLKDLIARNHMDWTQLYMDEQSNGKTFLKDCNIQSFPTAILLDPEGKVVYRGTSGESIDNAEIVLQKIFSQSK